MINPDQLEALRVIEASLAPRNIVWVITGSVAFALYGLDFTPNDIDLQTDRSGAFAIEAALAGHIIRRVEFRASEKIRSYFGSATINGVTIEIMGDIQKRKPDGHWTEPVDLVRYRRWIERDGMRLPVLALDYEYNAYQLLGRAETAAKIKAWLANNPPES